MDYLKTRRNGPRQRFPALYIYTYAPTLLLLVPCLYTIFHGLTRNPGAPTIAFHVLTSHDNLLKYLDGHSDEWWGELQTVGSLIFSIGQGPDSNHSKALFKSVYKRWPGVLLYQLAVPDDQYPPIVKTLQSFEHLGRIIAYQYDFVFNLDDDTYFHPVRLAAIVASRNSNDPLYMGRPLQHCNCEPGQVTEDNCTNELATSYCAGAGYLFSSASLKAMQGKWTSCLQDHKVVYERLCTSSDTFVGLCMNRYANTKCKAASIDGTYPTTTLLNDDIRAYVAKAIRAANHTVEGAIAPTHGVSWRAMRMSSSSSLEIHTLFCQDWTHTGGPNQRNYTSSIHLFDESDRALCAYMHPMKMNGSLSPAHFRYARYIMEAGR